MSFLNNLSIRARIILVVALPVLSIVFMSAQNSLKAYKDKREALKLVQVAEVAPEISKLVHDLQKERGKTAGYLSADSAEKKQTFRNELDKFYKSTKKHENELSVAIQAMDLKLFSPKFNELIESVQGRLKHADTIRENVFLGKYDVKKAVGEYTKDIVGLLEVIEYIASHSKDAELTDRFAGYVGILEMQEAMGKERATGASALQKGVITLANRTKLSELYGTQNAYEHVFKAYATEEEAAFYKAEVEDSKTYKEVTRLRKMFLDPTYEAQMLYSVSGLQWFNTWTDEINKLTNVENRIRDDIQEHVHHLYDRAESDLIFQIIAGVVQVLITLFLVLLIAKTINSAIERLTRSMEKLADGDLEAEIPNVGKGHDLEVMANTLGVFKENTAQMREMEEEQKAQEIRAAEERKKTMMQMADDFESRVGTIASSVASASEQMQLLSDSLAAAVEETTAQCSAVASAADEANTNVQSVAAASEEMNAAINEVSRNVTDTAQTARECTEAAQNSQRQLDHLQVAITDIDTVIQSINEVAEQTNLLALNATIEAARAGEAGKGFAVVASEVKNLASQTHKMTDEITSRVDSVKETAASTIQTINGILSQIESVDGKTSNVATAVEEQSVTTQEISRSAQNAAAGAESVNGNIQNIQEATNESAQSCASLKEASNALNQEAEQLKVAMESFLTEIRAA